MKAVVLTTSLIFMLSGCNSVGKHLTISEYSTWSNGVNYPYNSSCEASDIHYSLKLYTTDLELARSISLGDTKPEEEQVFKAAYANSSTAVLKIILPDSRSTIFDFNPDHSYTRPERISYYSFNFSTAFKAVSKSGDTVNCSYAAVEPGGSSYYIATANLEFPLSFSEISSILFNDEILSGKQLVFNFNPIDKKTKSPKLKL